MKLDKKGCVKMEGVLILTLLISGCSEEQKIKWEVNKQIRRIKSKNVEVRVDAAEALGQIGPAAIMALIQALKDKGDSSVRYWSAKALGQIGPKAKAAVPALAQALKDIEDSYSPYFRESAVEALEKINIEAEATEDAEFDF